MSGESRYFDPTLMDAIAAAFATVRAAAIEATLTDVLTRIEAVNTHLTVGSASGGMMKKIILAEIQSARTGKVESDEA